MQRAKFPRRRDLADFFAPNLAVARRRRRATGQSFRRRHMPPRVMRPRPPGARAGPLGPLRPASSYRRQKCASSRTCRARSRRCASCAATSSSPDRGPSPARPPCGPAIDLAPEKRLGSTKVFNRKRLVASRITEAKVDVDRILDEPGRPNEPMLRDMLSNYGRAGEQGGDGLLSRLRAFTKVHEARSSSLEVSEFKKRVKHRDTRDYVDEPNRAVLKKSRVSY